MVFLLLTRQAVADMFDGPEGTATAVWANPGVLTDEELARMQASGIEVHVLPDAIAPGTTAQIAQLAERIRRTHGGTLWVEYPAVSSPAEELRPQPRTEPEPEPEPEPSSMTPAPLAASGRARAVSAWAVRMLKRLSAADGPLMIVPYMGFGTADRLVLQGRVIQDEGFAPPSKSRTAWSNFHELYKRIDSSEVPGARVMARFQDIEREAVTNSAGYFRLDLPLARPLERLGWHEVEIRLLSPARSSGDSSDSIRARAQVLVPPPTARFGVISDIDDTVLWSNVTNKLRMLKMLAMTNAHTRKPFKGVTAFYCALRDGIGGDDGNPIFYVSSSPWHLYTPLVDFLQAQGIPLGPLMLRELGVSQLFGRDRHHGHKLENIEKIFQTYPDLPFILIGDSGQQDPEIYREVVSRHPQRVRAIYIRNVNPDPARIEALDQLIEEVRPTGTQLLLVPDSESAAAHAAAEGLINPLGMRRVRSDKQDDSSLLVSRK